MANRKSRWLDGGEGVARGGLGPAIIVDPSNKGRSGLAQTVSMAMAMGKKGKTQQRIEEKS